MAILRDNKGRIIKGSSNAWNKGLKGFTHSGSFKKGMSSWNKGKSCPWVKKASWLFKKGENLGEEHPRWRGIYVNYSGLHMWVSRHLGEPQKCEHCGVVSNLQWANKSGEYKRDLRDWLSLCIPCHKKYYIVKNSF